MILAISVQSIGAFAIAFLFDKTKEQKGNVTGAIASFFLFT